MSASATHSPRRKWILILAVAMFLGCGAAVGLYLTSRPPPAVPEIHVEGSDQQLNAAIEKARAAVVEQRSGEAWGNLGRVLLANESHQEVALQCFLEAERLDPANPRWPYFSGGILLVDQAKPEQALPRLERAVQLGVLYPPAAPRLLLGETLLSLGRLEQAEEHFKRVAATDAQDPRVNYDLGLLAWSRGDWELARNYLEPCLASPQARKKASTLLATACGQLGDQANAEKYAQYVRAMPPDADWADPYVAEHRQLIVRKRARFRTVENLEAQGQYKEAATILFKLVDDDPKDYLPHLTLGRILPQMGDLARAEQHLDKARELAPDKLQVYYLLSLVLFRKAEALAASEDDRAQAQGLFKESADYARQVLKLRPDYGYAHMSLGLALKQLGKDDEALAAFKEAVHCNPEFGENHLLLGQALAEKNDVEKARYHLQQAQLLNGPSDPRPAAALKRLEEKE